MTWLYNGTRGSIAVVAVWHALFDFFSGSQATNGLMNGVMSTLIALWAVAIVVVAFWHQRGAAHAVAPGTQADPVRL
jgi:hypothetical protein